MKVLGIISVFLFVLNSLLHGQEAVPLYEGLIPDSKGTITPEEIPRVDVYRPKDGSSRRTAVLIFPGGAYTFLAYEEEGVNIAKAFANVGITAFVVKYRLPRKRIMNDKSIGPLMDAQQAMKLVRSNSIKYNIDSTKIGVVGFSAGGHLASTLGTHYIKKYILNSKNVNLRPDFMILFYPLITMVDSMTHIGSKISLLGVEPTNEKVIEYSNDQQVTQNTPPTYLTHCGDDQVVNVCNSILFYKALQSKGVDAELHLFPKGDHGFIQRIEVNEWLNPILRFLIRENFYTN